MSGKTVRFKRRFKPTKVQIDGKDDSVYEFETVALTRSSEREFAEAQEKANRGLIEKAEYEFSAEEAQEAVVDLITGAIDMLIAPVAGKKTKASKVLRALWEAEEIELGDMLDFLNDLATNRRPT